MAKIPEGEWADLRSEISQLNIKMLEVIEAWVKEQDCIIPEQWQDMMDRALEIDFEIDNEAVTREIQRQWDEWEEEQE